MKNYVLSLRGKKDRLIQAEDWKLITHEAAQYYIFLVSGAETARYRESDVQGIEELTGKGGREPTPPEPEAEPQRTYHLPRV